MNRRAFLLGSAAAIASPILPPSPKVHVFGVDPGRNSLTVRYVVKGVDEFNRQITEVIDAIDDMGRWVPHPDIGGVRLEWENPNAT